MVRAARKASAAGLVNAVLRRMSRAPEWPNRAVRLSMPAWLLERWDREFGVERRPARRSRPGAAQEYRRNERQMDIGAQAVAELVAARPGQRVLDLCAAPGNKTAVWGRQARRCMRPTPRRAVCGKWAPPCRASAGCYPPCVSPVFDWVLPTFRARARVRWPAIRRSSGGSSQPIWLVMRRGRRRSSGRAGLPQAWGRLLRDLLLERRRSGSRGTRCRGRVQREMCASRPERGDGFQPS